MTDSMPKDARPRWRSPWFGSLTGLAACLLALVWGAAVGGVGELPRLTLVWLGLLLAGIGIAARFQQTAPSRIAQTPGVMLIAGILFGILALAATVVLAASWAEVYLLGLRPGLALIFWLFAAPVSAHAAWRCWRRGAAPPPLAPGEEGCLSLLVAGCACFVSAAALTSVDPEAAPTPFTLQRFLFVAGIVALLGAALAVADLPFRRAVVSGLAVFHFGGILTATLGHPPTPWLIDQLWVRIYRPYLQFMYMNNAYHFYAPEPGPPSHLWFRLHFLDEKGEAKAHWLKLPKLDEKGRHGHKTTLEYFRVLSVTENSMPTQAVASENEYFQKILQKRLARTPDGAKNAVIGQPQGAAEMLIPMHPTMFRSHQYYPPRPDVKRVIESYARSVLQQHQQEHPDRKYTTVKIYRVIHAIPPTALYLNGWPPTDPRFYNPIYLGEYDTEGQLLNDEDPFLYWQLPIMRDPDKVNDIDAPVYDWARRHAGDRYWRRIPVQGGYFVWVDDDNQQEP